MVHTRTDNRAHPKTVNSSCEQPELLPQIRARNNFPAYATTIPRRGICGEQPHGGLPSQGTARSHSDQNFTKQASGRGVLTRRHSIFRYCQAFLNGFPQRTQKLLAKGGFRLPQFLQTIPPGSLERSLGIARLATAAIIMTTANDSPQMLPSI